MNREEALEKIKLIWNIGLSMNVDFPLVNFKGKSVRQMVEETEAVLEAIDA